MGRQAVWSAVVGGLMAAVLGFAALVAVPPEPRAQEHVVAAAPSSSVVPSRTDATPTTPAEAATALPTPGPAIAASGYVVAGESCDGPRVTSARVGDVVMECWVIENTGSVPFGFHLIQSNFIALDEPPFDYNAPDERAITLAVGQTLVHPGGTPVTLDRAGTWRAGLLWEAFEGPEVAGQEATTSLELDLQVASAPAVATTPATLPATT
jgi:hypothetical protein